MAWLETPAATATARTAGTSRRCGKTNSTGTANARTTPRPAGETAAAGSAAGSTKWTTAAGAGTAAARVASRHAASARSARQTASARATRLRVHPQEGPLVVVVPTLIQANRFLFALAADAHDAAHHGVVAAERTGLLRCRRTGRTPLRRASRRPAASGLPGLARRRLSRHAAGADKLEVVTGDRVLVLLAQEVASHQHVYGGRHGSWRAGLVEPKRADVLLPAKDQLLFLLPLGFVSPHGQGGRHQHGHHRHGHEQGGHRVSRRTLTP